MATTPKKPEALQDAALDQVTGGTGRIVYVDPNRKPSVITDAGDPEPPMPPGQDS